MSKFIVVNDTKIVLVADGKKFGSGRNCLDVPDESPVIVGSDINEYDENWNFKPIAERIKNGFVKLDNRLELVGDEVRQKSPVKLILEGIEQLPAGYKLVPKDRAPLTHVVEDGYAIVEKTPFDLMAEGVLDIPEGYKSERDEKGEFFLKEMSEDEKKQIGILTDKDILKNEFSIKLYKLYEELNKTNEDILEGMEFMLSDGKFGSKLKESVLIDRHNIKENIENIKKFLSD